jgi:hypothetical protein
VADVKVKLLRPLNGADVGTTATYSEADAKRLASTGAVEIIQAKAEAAPQNKMEAALANKAARRMKKA